MVIVFEHQRGGATAGHQSVAVAVKGPAGLRRLVHADGERTQGIEGCHGVVVRLLCATAEHHVLEALLDEHIAQADAVAATGAGRADGEVHATDVEDRAEVHVHRRVHRLEDTAIAQHGGVVFLVHDLRGLDDRLGR